MRSRGAQPRLAAPLFAVACLALLAAGCGGTSAATTVTLVPVNGGSITVGIDQAPTGCNPNTVAGATWANQLILESVLPSTFVVSDNGQATGNATLASAEVTSDKPQTVVYTLNPKAVWSDGTPIRADDFVYAWEQQRSSTDAASTQGYRDIRSVTGSNQGHTVTVVFGTNFADWRMLFNFLVPAHVMEHRGWDPSCHTIDPAIDLSAGPFVIHAVSATEVSLVRNPRWWEQPAALSGLTIRFAGSSRQLARWMADGTVQVAEPSSFDQSVMAGMNAQPQDSTSVSPSSTFLQLELSATSPVTGTTAVREAVAHAIDRQALVDQETGWADSDIEPAASHIYSQADGPYPKQGSNSSVPNTLDGGNVTTTSTTPPSPTPSAPFPTVADPALTARLLESAGYAAGPSGAWVDLTGSPLVLHLAVDEADPWAATTATLLDTQLSRAGFTVDVISEPSLTAAGEALAGGPADMALLPMASTTYPSQATAWYSMLLGSPGLDGSQDWTNFSSPTLDNLLTRASQELNPVTGATLYQQADALLWSQMVALPLFDEPLLLAQSNDVSGVGPNPFGAGLLWYPSTWQTQALQPTSRTTGS